LTLSKQANPITLENAERTLSEFPYGSINSASDAERYKGEFDWAHTSFDASGHKEFTSTSSREDTLRTAYTHRGENLVAEKSVITSGARQREHNIFHEYDTQDRHIRTIDDASGMITETVYKEDEEPETYIYHRSNPVAKLCGEVFEDTETKIGVNHQSGSLVSMTESTEGMANTSLFEHEKENLVKLESGNTKFTYSHDEFSRRNRINLNGELFVSQNHEDHTVRFANGFGYRTVLDNLGRVIRIDYLQGEGRVEFVTNEYTDVRFPDLITRTTNPNSPTMSKEGWRKNQAG